MFHYFFGSLFTVHYKNGHYSLIIIPHLDPHHIQSRRLNIKNNFRFFSTFLKITVGGFVNKKIKKSGLICDILKILL